MDRRCVLRFSQFWSPSLPWLLSPHWHLRRVPPSPRLRADTVTESRRVPEQKANEFGEPPEGKKSCGQARTLERCIEMGTKLLRRPAHDLDVFLDRGLCPRRDAPHQTGRGRALEHLPPCRALVAQPVSKLFGRRDSPALKTRTGSAREWKVGRKGQLPHATHAVASGSGVR